MPEIVTVDNEAHLYVQPDMDVLHGCFSHVTDLDFSFIFKKIVKLNHKKNIILMINKIATTLFMILLIT